MNHSQQSLNPSGHFSLNSLQPISSYFGDVAGGTLIRASRTEMIDIFLVSGWFLSRCMPHVSLYFLGFHLRFNSLSIYITDLIACPYTMQVYFDITVYPKKKFCDTNVCKYHLLNQQTFLYFFIF